VHGDYSPKNILLHDGRLVLLDHEVIHWGDPAFDLGFALTHLLSKAHYHTHRREAFFAAARDFWTDYQSMLGDVHWLGDLEGFAVKHTTACLLARVVGRSPLEYLDAGQQAQQRRVALDLIERLPPTVDALIETFAQGINSDGNH
jgi:thiamine kinase-like enzyme